MFKFEEEWVPARDQFLEKGKKSNMDRATVEVLQWLVSHPFGFAQGKLDKK